MFCFLETKVSEQRPLLCQWVEHYYEAGKRIQIVVDSSLAAQHLDQMLWSFSQSSFIPHRILSSVEGVAEEEPVVITVGEVRLERCGVLICDSGGRAEFMMRYPIAFHFILLDDQERRNGSRMLWQQSKELGVELRHVPYASNHPKSGGSQSTQSMATM